MPGLAEERRKSNARKARMTTKTSWMEKARRDRRCRGLSSQALSLADWVGTMLGGRSGRPHRWRRCCRQQGNRWRIQSVTMSPPSARATHIIVRIAVDLGYAALITSNKLLMIEAPALPAVVVRRRSGTAAARSLSLCSDCRQRADPPLKINTSRRRRSSLTMRAQHRKR